MTDGTVSPGEILDPTRSFAGMDSMGAKTESHLVGHADPRSPWPKLMRGLCGVLETAVLVVDCEHRIVFASDGAERLLSYPTDQLLGTAIDTVIVDQYINSHRLRRVDAAHPRGPRETVDNRPLRLRARDGRELEVFASVTEEPSDLSQYQLWVFESAARPVANPITAGVAHDIKGVMAAIRNFTSVALYHSQDKGIDEPLRQVLSAADRVAEMVQQMIPTPPKGDVPVAAAIANSVALLEMACPAHLRLRSKIDLQSSTTTRCIDAQWHQLVLNLGWNAFAASGMPATVHLSVVEVDLAEPVQCVHATLPRGAYVLLEVGDEGVGVDDELVSHLFEPYVSSHHTGSEQRGLGLYVVRSIVQSAAGGIQVRPNRPRGTLFRVFVPCIRTMHRS